jgi:TonB family protein
MALSGHSGELALVDLVQANALGRNTCRIAVYTSTHNGVIFVRDGSILHASLGDLSGPEAFYAAVTADDVFFHVDSGVTGETTSIATGWQTLVLEAMRRKDEGILRQPSAESARKTEVPAVHGRLETAQEAAAVAAGPPRLAGAPPGVAVEAPMGRARSPWPVVAVGALLATAAVVAWLLLASPHAQVDARSTPSAAPSAPVEVVEANELTGPGDVLPNLIAGTAPRSPDPTLSVSPTVVCRILLDETGRVVDAKIYRSRLDLARFEEVALDTVAGYRFTPAIRKGQPVKVWLNWPVSFQ